MTRQSIATTAVLLAALMLPGAPLYAQKRDNVQGRIDEVMLDEQYIVIDGKRLVLREADMVVTYKGQPLRASLLAPGMALFFSTHEDGSIRTITLIGPADVLDQINNH